MVSPLEKAILDLPKTGWTLMGLGKSPFDCVNPWSCDLVPMHFGTYYFGKKIQLGSYSAYQNAMVRITGSGDTALAAIQDARAKLDKHPAKAIYRDLERAFEDLLDERSKST